MSLRGEGVGIFLCLNSLPNKCLPKFDRRFQLCRQPPLRGCCSAVQCSVRIVSQLRPALENFLVGYYAHQTQMCGPSPCVVLLKCHWLIGNVTDGPSPAPGGGGWQPLECRSSQLSHLDVNRGNWGPLTPTTGLTTNLRYTFSRRP